MKITDFPHLRAVLEQIDFAHLLTEDAGRMSEKLAFQISETCQKHGRNNFEVMLALLLYLEQSSTDYARTAGIKPKPRIQ